MSIDLIERLSLLHDASTVVTYFSVKMLTMSLTPLKRPLRV
jgi:hypothetical protein